MSSFHLAQFNIARLAAPIEAAESAEFRNALDQINALAEASPGFIWRATGAGFDAEAPAHDIDPMILANLSVWENLEALAAFVYRSAHGHFVRHRNRWFAPAAKAYQALWWITPGQEPDRAQAFARLEHLQSCGATAYAFDFRDRFAAPSVLAHAQ